MLARAQQPTIGFLDGRSPSTIPPFALGWREGLREIGYVEGTNLKIEYRWAEGRFQRLPQLAAELVRHQVDVVLAAGNAAAEAAKAASGSIPLVFVAGLDPVESGLVASLNRPGGNLTGISLQTIDVVAKRLELLREAVPNTTDIAALINPTKPGAESESNQLEIAARGLGLRLYLLRAASESDVDTALASAVQQKARALLVTADVFFDMQRNQLIERAARYRLPACYSNREYVVGGGLLSYGEDRKESYRQAGIYVGRILKGDKPANLPVQQPTKFELAINLKTAKALGLEIPPLLLALADEVIE